MYKPNMSLTKTPVFTQDIMGRVTNFDEVVLSYTEEEAMEEAARCLNCPGRYCVASCPISTPIPEFIKLIRDGDITGAYALITDSNPMTAVSCRVCAQERQCEKNCTRGIKGEPTAIGRLERFVVDWNRMNIDKTVNIPETIGKCVAVVGSGPAGLTCAGKLAEAGYKVHIYESRPYAGGVPADDKGYVKVGKDGISTMVEGVFAGGDVVGRDATLILAVADGKRAAEAIDEYLKK